MSQQENKVAHAQQLTPRQEQARERAREREQAKDQAEIEQRVEEAREILAEHDPEYRHRERLEKAVAAWAMVEEAAILLEGAYPTWNTSARPPFSERENHPSKLWNLPQTLEDLALNDFRTLILRTFGEPAAVLRVGERFVSPDIGNPERNTAANALYRRVRRHEDSLRRRKAGKLAGGSFTVPASEIRDLLGWWGQDPEDPDTDAAAIAALPDRHLVDVSVCAIASGMLYAMASTVTPDGTSVRTGLGALTDLPPALLELAVPHLPPVPPAGD